MERATREIWAKRVERWRESGLTAREYAAETGLNPRTLAWWKSQLGTGSRRAATTGTRPARVRRASLVPALSFVELTSAPAERGSREPFEVVLTSGERVRVATDFDDAALARLLDVLRAPAR